MRLRLKLSPRGAERTLPINYQYEVAAWIYKVIHRSDAAFAEWLHSRGYSFHGKRFKQFTFSHLRIPERRVEGDRIVMLGSLAEMQVSFAVERAVEHFLGGLFADQQFSIGDRQSRASFLVEQVETLAEPDFNAGLRLRALSPICVGRGNDGRGATYIGPEARDYAERITANLRAKLGSISADAMSTEPVAVRQIGTAKSRLIRIKTDTEHETRVRAFQFRCDLSGPADLLRVAYQAGLGEKNSLGFGCMEVVA